MTEGDRSSRFTTTASDAVANPANVVPGEEHGLDSMGSTHMRSETDGARIEDATSTSRGQSIGDAMSVEPSRLP